MGFGDEGKEREGVRKGQGLQPNNSALRKPQVGKLKQGWTYFPKSGYEYFRIFTAKKVEKKDFFGSKFLLWLQEALKVKM